MSLVTSRLFETGTITGNDGFTSVTGSPVIDTSSKMKGLNCARTQWTTTNNVNGSVGGLASSEFWMQFYINVAQYPTTATTRVVSSTNGTTQWNITMTTAGVLTLRNGGTNIHVNFLTVSLNTTYRIGIHFKNESTLGAADGVLEVWTQTGDTAFGSAIFSSSAYAMVTSAASITSVVFGQNNAVSVAGDVYWDDIRVDNAAMPGTAGLILDDLIGYWTLEEASGTRADSLGVLTLSDNNTVTQGTGIQGNAALFTRANSEYLSRADGAALSAGNINVAWGMWVKMVTKPAANASIIGKWNYSGTQREYTIGYDGTSDRFYLQVSLDGTNTGATVVSANNFGSPSTGVWYFIVASHNAGSDLLSISVNAGTADTASHTTGIFDGTSNFNIGAMNNGTDLFWDGYIDEVGFWKRILTSTEITFLYNSGAGKTYPLAANSNTAKNITVTVTSTLVFGPKAVGKPIALAVTAAASILRAISLIRALVVTVLLSAIKAKPLLVSLVVNSAATIQKTIGKPISLAVTSTIARLTAYAKTITKAVTSTVTATKDVPKVITKAVSNTISLQRAILKPITKVVTGTIIFAKGLVTLKTITYAVTSTVSFVKGFLYSKLITYAVTSTVTFVKGMVTLKTITLAVTSTKSVLKNVGKPISRTVTSTLSRILNIPHNVLVTVTTVRFLQRDIAVTKIKAITSTVSAVVGKGYLKTFTLVVNVSSLIQKNILKPITVVESVLVSLQPKNIGKYIATVVNTVITATHGLANFKTITYNVSASIVKRLDVGKTISYVQGTVVSMQKSFTLLISVFINAPVVLNVQKNILLVRSIVVDTVIFFSKILQNINSNTPFNKNVRSLTLGLKNRALGVLGKNTRTIDLQDTNES